MRWLLIAPLVVLGACTTRPAFVPPPQKLFANFQALPRPVREIAPGALWIQHHGPQGAGAALDNLETQAGISSVVVDNDLHAALSLGFLQYLDLDPSLQSKVSVRLNDVTLVRVKDMAKLDGPGEQPRIYEALRAGSATITTTREIGIAIESRIADQGMPVFGRGSSGKRSSFTVEAKDVYLAVHVASLRSVRTKPVRLQLKAELRRVQLHGLDVQVVTDPKTKCQSAELIAFKGGGQALERTEIDPRKRVEIMLAAPIGLGRALFNRIAIEPDRQSSQRCAIRLALRGTALVSERG